MAAAAGPRSPPPARAPALPTAAPTLKVMRLQAPSLTQPNAGSLGPNSMLGPAATLPDTFGTIHIGETFTAYLGVVNADPSLPIRNLSLSAQLQTPSRRWPLPSGLDGGGGEGSDGAGGALTVAPGSGVDTIVSRPIDEVGQHILRVEVSYGAGPTARTLRKFYRFGVASPLHIRELTARAGDDRCFVSIAVENAGADGITLTVLDLPRSRASVGAYVSTLVRTTRPKRRSAHAGQGTLGGRHSHSCRQSSVSVRMHVGPVGASRYFDLPRLGLVLDGVLDIRHVWL